MPTWAGSADLGRAKYMAVSEETKHSAKIGMRVKERTLSCVLSNTNGVSPQKVKSAMALRITRTFLSVSRSCQTAGTSVMSERIESILGPMRLCEELQRWVYTARRRNVDVVLIEDPSL